MSAEIDDMIDTLMVNLKEAAWALESHLYEQKKQVGFWPPVAHPRYQLFTQAQATRLLINELGPQIKEEALTDKQALLDEAFNAGYKAGERARDTAPDEEGTK